MAADFLPQGQASTGPVPSPPPQSGSLPAPANMDPGAATVTFLLSGGQRAGGQGHGRALALGSAYCSCNRVSPVPIRPEGPFRLREQHM